MIQQTREEQQAAQAAAEREARVTKSVVIPVITIVLMVALVAALVTAKRRMKEAKEREDEKELSALTKPATVSAVATSARKKATRDLIMSVVEVEPEDTYGEAGAAVAPATEVPQYAEAGPPSPELRPASLALSADSASIRMVSTRRQNPLYAAAGAAEVQQAPLYDQGRNGLVEDSTYDAANNNASNQYEYESAVPLYAAADGDAPAAAPATILYEVAGQEEQPSVANASYDVAAGSLVDQSATATANYDVANEIPAQASAAYDVAATVPTGPVLYAIADDGDVHAPKSNGDVGGLHHMPGQPLRRSNSYGNALNDIPDSPDVHAPAAGEGPYI